MEKSYFLSTTFNDVIFKGRNRAYGAYILRKNYSKHIFISGILATSIFSGALVGPLVNNIFFSEKVEYQEPVYILSEPIDIPPPPLVKPKKAEVVPATGQPAEKVKTEKFTKPEVVPNNRAVEEEILPEQDKLHTVNIGSKTIEGKLPTAPDITTITEPTEEGTITGNTETTEAFYSVEEMPLYVGGEKAMFSYLGKNIKYPAEAQREGMEGVVVVSFVIASNGKITDAQVVKGLGYGMDEEALRVVNSMPDWQPGRQNGKAVSVRYTLPIRFSLK